MVLKTISPGCGVWVSLMLFCLQFLEAMGKLSETLPNGNVIFERCEGSSK